MHSDFDNSNLCSIGSIPWTLKEIQQELEEFQQTYDDRPVTHSLSGSNLFHAFAQWCLIRMLKPKFIIESGAMLGWGTFMLRKAAGPDTHIVVVSPDSPAEVGTQLKKLYYMDHMGPSSYLTGSKFQDFGNIDWSAVGIDSPEKKAATLIYFDDHQSGYRRLLEAQRAGFTHLMYDDNYPWPGDNFSLKQSCDRTGTLFSVRQSLKDPGYSQDQQSPSVTFPYLGDFSKFSAKISPDHKSCLHDDMLERLATYYEFPPLWPGPFRHQEGPLLSSIRQKPVMTFDEGKVFLSRFRKLNLSAEDEASKYTFFLYVKIKKSTPAQKNCLAELHFPSKYQLTI